MGWKLGQRRITQQCSCSAAVSSINRSVQVVAALSLLLVSLILLPNSAEASPAAFIQGLPRRTRDKAITNCLIGKSLRPKASQTVGFSALSAGNFFSDIQRFFDDLNNDGKRNGKDDNDDNDEDDFAGGTAPIVNIPVQKVKRGGLRLFLMFYLMGMQNTPDRCSWKADQPCNGPEEYSIDFYFHDKTAILSTKIEEGAIKMYRIGTTPSTAYMMQETVIVQGLLDELDQCAFDENVPKQDRLLQLAGTENGIEEARDLLPFG